MVLLWLNIAVGRLAGWQVGYIKIFFYLMIVDKSRVDCSPYL